MDLDTITPLILTYNESSNIKKTLDHLHWAKQIIVIDSFSNDDTVEILQQYNQVSLLQRKFDDHTSQWNFGLSQVETEWVLTLDADYLIPRHLYYELYALHLDREVDGYFANFKYCINGRPLRGTILPPRLVLFRRELAKYVQDGHTQLLKLDGKAKKLISPIYHDDRKPLSHWLWAQDRYMKMEVKKLMALSNEALTKADRIRKKKYFAPFIVFFYCLFIKRGILDGWRGWYYAFQRLLAEILLSLEIMNYENTLNQKKGV